MISTCSDAPMPTPRMNRYSDTIQKLESMPSRDSRNRPRVISAVPITGKILYRPHLETRKPVPVEVSSSPTSRGSSLSPDTVGEIPRTTCMYCGR